MVSCVVHNWEGKESGEATVDLRIAREENAAHIVHRAMRRQMSNARQGTVASKTRAEVRGGGRKPWKQKGTGRARAGSNRSPLWRGGGVIFGPSPRDYSVKMNRKERRLALTTAFSSRSDDMVVVENFVDKLPRPKTKELAAALARWGIEEGSKVLLIVADKQENVYLSARNNASIKLVLAANLNVYDLLASDRIVATEDAIAKIQEVYSD
ncbi:50S ribosomal protein L4 [Acaryochloris thomasi RCC1774]|uniref:Large ribosomal subunit protein uL4 n=1 Tax=Acaryochloris thomasi RCC1774 TaxID=1764569 RepID=A0A2W1K6D0_9CYAN|nr:50S ribosomal protein L4 [Acaryochloris thomasi]PZD75301.1 50S ribosomal protein L4 [Acaryochloris thomasi RCC1774]